MAEEKNNQAPNVDVVKTDVGVLHVLPKAYQGGKMPATMRKEELPPPKPKKPTPAPKPLPPPATPKRPGASTTSPKPLSHRKRVQLFVALGVMGVVVVTLLIIWLTTSQAPPTVTVPPVTVPPVVTTTPEPTVPPPVVKEPTEPPTPFDAEPRPGRDTDSDGLSDVEETMYGSNPRLPDTDRDGFLDGNEVFHQYDPTLPDPATLLDRGLVQRFEGLIISFLYPAVWELGVATEEMPVLFRNELTAQTGETVSFEVRVFSGEQTRTALETYLRGLEDDDLVDLQYSTSKAGYPLAIRKDQAYAVLIVGDKLVTMIYDVNEKTTVDFVQTFQMMVNSLDLVSEIPPL